MNLLYGVEMRGSESGEVEKEGTPKFEFLLHGSVQHLHLGNGKCFHARFTVIFHKEMLLPSTSKVKCAFDI